MFAKNTADRHHLNKKKIKLILDLIAAAVTAIEKVAVFNIEYASRANR